MEDKGAFPAVGDMTHFPAGADNWAAPVALGPVAAEDGAAGVAGNGRAFYPGGMNRRTGGYNGCTFQSPTLPKIAEKICGQPGHFCRLHCFFQLCNPVRVYVRA